MVTDVVSSWNAEVPAPVGDVFERLSRSGVSFMVVGGAVRRFLLDEPASARDWDVAVDAPLAALPRVLGGGCVSVGRAPRTVLLMPLEGGMEIQFSPLRKLPAGDWDWLGIARMRGRYAVWFEDLAARDFTVGSVGWLPRDSLLLDPVGGGRDLLVRRVLGCYGNPGARLSDDPLRILRAARLAASLGLRADSLLLAHARRSVALLRSCPVERVRDELFKCMLVDVPSRAFGLMEQLRCLDELLPEVAACMGVEQNVHHRYDVYRHTLHCLDELTPRLLEECLCCWHEWSGPASEEDRPFERLLLTARLAALFHDVGKPFVACGGRFIGHEKESARLLRAAAERLRFPSSLTCTVELLVLRHMVMLGEEAQDAAYRRLVARVGVRDMPLLAALYEADRRATGRVRERDDWRRILRRCAEAWKAVRGEGELRLAVDGRDVMSLLGIPPGPRVGRVLRALREKVLEDPACNTRERLCAMILSIGDGRCEQGGGSVPIDTTRKEDMKDAR